jgi:hypothetical protein
MNAEEDDMLHRFRFVIAGVLIILVNQAVTFAVSASMPSALLSAGTTRYAAAQASAIADVSSSPSFADIPGMTKYITIPGGQTADVMVIFCGEAASGSASQYLVRAQIGGALAVPNWSYMTVGSGYGNSCISFYRLNVPAGNPAVKIQWRAPTSTVSMAHRSLLVIANIH